MRKRKKKAGYIGIVLIIVLIVILLGAVASVVCYDLFFDSGAGDKIWFWEKVPYQEVTNDQITGTVQEKEVKSCYYFHLLNEADQLIYQELSQGIWEQKEEIYVHCDDPEHANVILKSVLRDHPDYFWCDGAVRSTSYDRDFSSEVYTIVSPEYNCSVDEREKRQEQIDQATEEILADISMDAYDYDKVLSVYETIINRTDYNKEASDNQNIYSVFVGKKSVCAGYAKSVQYLLEKLGIPTIYVTGTVHDGSLHAWNIVFCNGEYYHLDATWGDPVYQQSEESMPPEYSNITYDYMCCDDAEIQRTHVVDVEYKLPECTHMECNYYVVNGMYFESFDREQTLEMMNHAVYERKNPTTFKYADEQTYEQAKDVILNELYQITAQNLCRFYGMNEVKYYYQDEDELRKFTMYWEYP